MPQAYSDDHDWVVATILSIPANMVKNAERRGTARIPTPAESLKVDVLETYCRQCRRPWDDVSGQPCAAAENRDHLIGGPTGERKKRKHPYHDCAEFGCDLGVLGTGA